MANPIVENLNNTDTRELPTEPGPRGVDTEVTPSPRPRVGSELAQQELSRAEEGAARALESRPNVGGIPDAQLTPISVNNPVLDPNTYSNAFTREAQDQATALSNLSGGSVPVYAGSTYSLPDTTPPANTLMGEFRASDFVPDTPSSQSGGSGTKPSGTFLRTAFDHYTDPSYQDRTKLQASGLDADSPTTNALQQAGSGLQGVFSLARRGITSLFRASQASGAAVVGAPTANDSSATSAAKNVGGFLLGGPALALLNADARRAYFDTLQNEWSGLGENEREALRQISPTSGAGQAGTRGPLQGDFGEYGTNLLGGLNYVIDGLGNQARANIAARVEVSDNPLELITNLILAPASNKELQAAARRNALAAWRGKDFSFLNPDGELGLVGDQYYNPEGTRAERLASRVSLPFRLAAGIALDTITGPDPMDVMTYLRRGLGKGAKTAKAVDVVPPTRLQEGLTTLQRPTNTKLQSVPTTLQADSPTKFQGLDLLPDPWDAEESIRTLTSVPSIGVVPIRPTGGGVDVSKLFTDPTNSVALTDIRVLPQLPNVGTPDLSPNLRRPRRLVSDELGTALDEATADLPTLDLTTGRMSPVVEPDLDAVAPPRIASFDDIEPVEWGSPASQRTSRDSIQFGLPQRAPRGPLEVLSEEPIEQLSRRADNVRPNLSAADETLDLPSMNPAESTLDLNPRASQPVTVPDEVSDILDTIPKQYEDMSLEELFAEVDRIGAKYDDIPAEAVADLDAARRARDLLREAGWDDLNAVSTEKISKLRTRGPIGVVRDTPGSVVQGNFPPRPVADVVDIFTKQVREAPAQALEDVDLSRKVLEHATAAGTALVTDRGAIVRADEFLGAGARQIADLQNKADIARQAGRTDVAAQHEAVINAIRGSAKNNPVSLPSRTDVLTPDEVDELVPPITVEQLTPNRRADQAVRELGSTNLLDQAFDLKAIERSNLVTRTREDLQALARWMGHVNPDEHLTWKRLRQLHEQHGLYNAYGPKINGNELDRARRNGVRRVQQVEPNPLLNVPGQSTIISTTPEVLKNQVNKAAVTEQNLLGTDAVLALLKGKPLTDETVERLVKSWVNSPGKSSTRRNLNTIMGGVGGYQYTPDQIAALKTTYGALPKKQQAKLPAGLKKILREELPPTPRSVVNDAPTPLSELLEPGVSAKQLRATSVPSELRSASDETLAAFVETRSRALDTRQAIVELEADLALVEAEQSLIYQDLAELPELEPRSVMTGTWENGRVNERVETVLEVLDSPVNRRANDPVFTGAQIASDSVLDDLYYGSPFLGGVENPRQLPLGSANPLRGAYPPGFAVVTNDPKLARALAQGRVPDNTVLGDLVPNPAVDKVYLSPDSIVLDGDAPLPPVEYERLLVKLSEFIDPVDRDTLREILKKVPDLKDAPLGRVMERLQEGWVKAYPNKAPNDLLFAALGSGYREYVGRNGDALLMNLPGGRQVFLTPSPARALAEQFQRTSASVLLPSDAALHRAYADEVLAEGGRTLSQVLGKNNRNQHAIELTQELTDELSTLDNQLDELLDTESVLKKEAADLTEKEALEQSARRELAQSKRVESEFDDVLNNSSTDPGCL